MADTEATADSRVEYRDSPRRLSGTGAQELCFPAQLMGALHRVEKVGWATAAAAVAAETTAAAAETAGAGSGRATAAVAATASCCLVVKA